MRRKNLRTLLLVFFAFFAIVTFIHFNAKEAEGRAGSGQRYSSGRSSYSGSSRSGRRGGGGEGIIFELLIRLCFHHPMIGIPLLIVFAIVVYKGQNEGREQYTDYVIRKGSGIKQNYNFDGLFEDLKKRDLAFNENHFNERVKKAFEAIQMGWSDRNLSKAQAFLSDGVFEQFSIQLSEMKEKKIIDFMSNLQIKRVQTVDVNSDKNFDVVHVKIDASAINYRKDEKTGAFIEGSKSPQDFSEVWSFVRKPGAKTTRKPGLVEGQCPNCGNPISIGRVSKCDVCNSLLRSGEYDWVLSEITQTCEWAPARLKNIPGLAELVKKDPGFNTQHLEDRVTVIFWRMISAQRKANIDPLRKVADELFCSRFKAGFKPDNSGVQRFYIDCAIGSAELLGIKLGEPYDKAFVEVAWSGSPGFKEKDGKIAKAGQPINFHQVFALIRKPNVKTKIADSMASAHCPGCGAPEQSSEQNQCEYCGIVLNDGANDWVLENVLTKSDAEAREIIAELQKNSQKSAPRPENSFTSALNSKVPAAARPSSIPPADMIRFMIATMLIDGHIDAKENAMIEDFANKNSIPKPKLSQIIQEVRSDRGAIDALIEKVGQDQGDELLKALGRVALADGRLASEEIDMLNRIGNKFGLSGVDVNMLLKKERAAMYQEAKELRRMAK